MPLVEVVKGLTTSDKAIERATRFCEQIGKETIVVNDRPGFATSRLSAAFGNEAWYMLMEGVASPQEIDKGVKLALGHPMGPFELGDLIGLDVPSERAPLPARDASATASALSAARRVRRCRVPGRKTGRGVYEYHNGGTHG